MRMVVNFGRGEKCDVYIGRPSKFGNPYQIGVHGNRQEVLVRFESYLASKPELIAAVRRELRGCVLGCHCSPLPCHGDHLSRIANDWQMVHLE